MRTQLLFALGLINLLANVPYIIDTYRRRTKPDIATWSTWALVNGIAGTAALAAGDALNSVVLAGSYFIGSFTITLLAITRGTRKYTSFDGLCQGLALVGVVLWLVAKNPSIAIVFAVAVDVLAALPSLRHARAHPREETWSTFYISGLVSIFLLCLTPSFTLAALAYPIDNVVINLVLAFVIIGGRARKRRRTKRIA